MIGCLNSDNRIISTTISALSLAYDYDDENVGSLSYSLAQGATKSFSYQYDENGNIISEQAPLTAFRLISPPMNMTKTTSLFPPKIPRQNGHIPMTTGEISPPKMNIRYRSTRAARKSTRQRKTAPIPTLMTQNGKIS